MVIVDAKTRVAVTTKQVLDVDTQTRDKVLVPPDPAMWRARYSAVMVPFLSWRWCCWLMRLTHCKLC